MKEKEKIEYFLQVPEEDMYRIIGSELKPFGFSLDNRNDQEKEEDGRRWYSENKTYIQKNICGSEIVKGIISSKDKFNKIELISAIIDLISLLKTGITPALIATIIVRNGLKEFCGNYL